MIAAGFCPAQAVCASSALIGDVLLPRQLRYPVNYRGRTAVVRGRSTFWTENAVPDPPGFAFRHTCARTARPSEASDGALQGLFLRHGLSLLADAGGVGLPTRPLED